MKAITAVIVLVVLSVSAQRDSPDENLRCTRVYERARLRGDYFDICGSNPALPDGVDTSSVCARGQRRFIYILYE